MSTPGPDLLEGPYKGLMPYREEDERFFFGRDAERELIVANLMASRLTLLYGSSGVGKSSVLRAGVVPHLKRLARGPIGAGACELVVAMYSSWRDDPVAGLARRVAEAARAQVPEASASPPADPSPGLVDTLRSWTERLRVDLFVLLDQFEEYFLYHPGEDGPGTFARELAETLKRPDLRVSVLVSIRDDALARLDWFEGRIPALFDNRLQVEHLTAAAARLAIEEPLRAYGRLRDRGGAEFRAEPALVDAVLDGARSGKVLLGDTGRGGLGPPSGPPDLAGVRIEAPYLQLVMTRLWSEERRAGSPVLRLATLRRLGGVERIVHTHLEAVMRGLPVEKQEIVARSFHYLVTPSGGKIAYTASDLAALAETERPALQAVMDELARPGVFVLRRVDPPARDPASPRYEIFHDILGKTVLDWRARYAAAKRWRASRPWGFVRVLASGRVHHLVSEVVSIGRSVQWWRHQLDLRARPVSRLHLLVSEKRVAIDLRSKYGTTVNGSFLTYGAPRPLSHGDVIVLAGVAPLGVGLLEYPPFDGSIVEPLTPIPADDPPPEGWGVLVDGTGRAWRLLSAGRYFLSLDPAQRVVASTERTGSSFMEVSRDEPTGIRAAYLDRARSMAVAIKPEQADHPVTVTVSPGAALPSLDGLIRVGADTVDFKRFDDFADAEEYHARGYKEYLGPAYLYEGAAFQILPLLRDLDPPDRPDEPM